MKETNGGMVYLCSVTSRSKAARLSNCPVQTWLITKFLEIFPLVIFILGALWPCPVCKQLKSLWGDGQGASNHIEKNK